MLRSVPNILGALLLLAVVTGCEDIASFSFAPYPDVDLTVMVRKVSYHDFEKPGKTTFVHFKYKVIVRSDVPVYFKVENVALRINGTVSNGAYYDTFAFIAPHWRRLKRGESVIEAYASFPGTIEAATLADIKVIRFGFSRKPEKEG